MEDQRRSPDLPIVIIHHIHSFLKFEDAAKTLLVSKSWLRAWSTCPFLQFQWTDSSVIDRTLEDYVERGISILKFRLCSHTIEERWLKMVQQCNVIDLLLFVDNLTDSLIQETFLTESLQVLSLTSRESFQLQTTLNIKCHNLKKLEFHGVLIDESTFQHIMSSCSLIEDLRIGGCSLIDITFSGDCASLKSLSLKSTDINDEQLHTLLSKSSQLENLSLIGCTNLVKPINLSSGTLTSVTLKHTRVKLVLHDAPNLRKLKYGRQNLMDLDFPITVVSPITKIEVKVTFDDYFGDKIDEFWFLGMRELLAKLAKSYVKIFLYQCSSFLNFEVLRATSLPPCGQVETLRFKGYEDQPLMYPFLSICHPKFVLLDPLDTMSKRTHLIKLFKDLTYRGHLRCCNFNDQNKNKCWRHYIKDAKLYYLVDNEKKPLDMIGLETGLGNKEVIFLALEWESSDQHVLTSQIC